MKRGISTRCEVLETSLALSGHPTVPYMGASMPSHLRNSGRDEQ